MPWFRDLSAEERSWVGQIVQAGIRAFVEWYGDGDDRRDADATGAVRVAGLRLRRGAARAGRRRSASSRPSTWCGCRSRWSRATSTTSSTRPTRADVHAAVLRYAREVAFATAEVYARAAEVRGAWDARLEALVRRRRAACRDRRDHAVASQRAGLGRARRRRRRAGRVPGAAHGDRPVRRRTPGGARGRAWTPSARPRANGWSCCSAASTDARAAGTALVDLFGVGSGRGGPGHRRPRPRPRLGAGRAGGPPGRRRLAERAAAGAEQRAAARAGAGRRRSRPTAPGRGRLPPARRGARGRWPSRWRRTSRRRRRSRAPRARCSCTPTPCATACGRSPT